MEKVFNPDAIENKWSKIWEQGNYFAPNAAAVKAPYCIMIPPPNVTGSLHMGHAFQDTIMDALIRYHRMQGNKTLWQMGVDHAGIATQMVVERKLQADNTSRHEIGREKFVERVWEWKEESGGTIGGQLRRLGASVDWSRERFTMDPGMSKAVQTVFIQLYNEGLIYRGQRLVNWDPILHTAISDLEVESSEEQGQLWYIRYPIVDSTEFLVVATTRPETMFGDSAVAVNPEDPRYKSLIGKKVALPLTQRTIPIIADDYVDPEFGTGCVKITPAHDFNDYAVGERHKLPKINIFTIDAKLNENTPHNYQGMDRFAARLQVEKDLTALNLIEKVVDHTMTIPRGDRSHTVVEPYLTDQWFVKIDSLAKPAIDAVKNGDIKFIPDNWSKTYFEWMHNIQDWCISRQLWWGHRIPAWYDNSGNIYVGESEAAVRSQYQLSADLPLRQDADVLDTWFSSALWPFSTLGWPDKTPEFKDYYPTNVLVTGFDIIFFWVARMIMFGLKFTGQIPFKEIYIHGLIQDQNGQKMSKSKGNIIDPIDLIDGIGLDELIAKRTKGLMQPKMEERIAKDTKKQFPDGIPAYGTDALRFTFCSLATNGRHLRFDFARLEGYRNFCTKIWNATRYVLMHAETTSAELVTSNLIDQWILSRWQNAKREYVNHLEAYRFDLAAQIMYDFTWNEFCDWYLELSKPNINDATRKTMKFVLGEMMQAMHPIMPFITEEIWQMLGGKDYLISHPFPAVNENLINPTAENTVENLKAIIMAVRNIRGEMNISPNKQVSVYINNASPEDKDIIIANSELLTALAKLEAIHWQQPDSACATALAANLEVLIPMKGLIDKDAEIARLTKEIQKISKDMLKTQTKLNTPSYVDKAPAEVVAKDKELLSNQQAAVAKLEASLDKVNSL